MIERQVSAHMIDEVEGALFASMEVAGAPEVAALPDW